MSARASTNMEAAPGPSQTASFTSPTIPTAASIASIAAPPLRGPSRPKARGAMPTASSTNTATAGSECARIIRVAGHEPVNQIVAIDAAGTTRPRRRPRLLLIAPALARRPQTGLPGVGPSAHAVGGNHSLRAGSRRRRNPSRSRAESANPSSSRNGRPTARFIFVSDRTGWWNLYRRVRPRQTIAGCAHGGRVRPAPVGLRNVRLCLRRPGRHRRILYRTGAHPPRADRPEHQRTDAHRSCRTPISPASGHRATASSSAPAPPPRPPASCCSTSPPATTRP